MIYETQQQLERIIQLLKLLDTSLFKTLKSNTQLSTVQALIKMYTLKMRECDF